MKLFNQTWISDNVLSRPGKYGFMLVLFCVILSAKASAQNSATTQKDTTGKVVVWLNDSYKSKPQPLIVLNGAIYHGSLSDINPNDISSINVLKGDAATSLYGSEGKNGVLLIKTKKSYSNIFKDQKTANPNPAGKDSTADKNNTKH